jgi:hypothetical protein
MTRAASSRPTSVHTEAELERKAFRLDRINRGVTRVIAAMRGGATLHRTHRPNSTQWQLSTGLSVGGDVARAVITRGDFVGIGDSLFGRELSQTWRYDETKGGIHDDR